LQGGGYVRVLLEEFLRSSPRRAFPNYICKILVLFKLQYSHFLKASRTHLQKSGPFGEDSDERRTRDMTFVADEMSWLSGT
jgi:hypothetical protein